MNGQIEQLQALIGDIDEVLNKATPSLPWVMAGGTVEQRQLLERVRSYLLGLQRDRQPSQPFGMTQGDAAWQQKSTTPNTPNAVSSGEFLRQSPQDPASQQILQAVIQELTYLRTGLTQPIQADVERLQQQRAALMEEIKQLELQRQYHLQGQVQNQVQSQGAPALPIETLYALIAQLQGLLAQSRLVSGAAPPMSLPEGSAVYAPASLGGVTSGGTAAEDGVPPYGSPEYASYAAIQQMQRLQAIQAQSDRLLMNLDSTLRIVCDSLQRNLQTYEESLSQGLQKMHSLGQQGEMMFTAWMNFLVQRLGQESAAYLSSYAATSPEIGAGELDASSSSTQSGRIPRLTPQTRLVLDQLGIKPPTIDLPYPGAELPANADAPSTSANRFSLEDMDLDDLDLSDLNLTAGIPEIATVSTVPDPVPNLGNSQVSAGVSQPTEVMPPQATVSETVAPQGIASQGTTSQEAGPQAVLPEDLTIDDVAADGDLSAAMELLEQLSATLQERTAGSPKLQTDGMTLDDGDGADQGTIEDGLFQEIVEEPLSTENHPEVLSDSVDQLSAEDILDALGELSEVSSGQPAPSTTIVSKFSDLPAPRRQSALGNYQDLDDFYNSLFGNGGSVSGSTPSEPGLEPAIETKLDPVSVAPPDEPLPSLPESCADDLMDDLVSVDDLSGIDDSSDDLLQLMDDSSPFMDDLLADGMLADDALDDALSVEELFPESESSAPSGSISETLPPSSVFPTTEQAQPVLDGLLPSQLFPDRLPNQPLTEGLFTETASTPQPSIDDMRSEQLILGDLADLGGEDVARTTAPEAGTRVVASESMVDILMSAPSLLQNETDSSGEETVIEPEIVEASVSLQSDGMLTLASSDLFPDVGIFTESDDRGVGDPAGDGNDLLPTGAWADGSTTTADPLPMTLEDLFRAEEPEPTDVMPPQTQLQMPPLPVTSVETHTLDRGDDIPARNTTPPATSIFTPLPALEDDPSNDLASLEEFLGSSAIDEPQSSLSTMPDAPASTLASASIQAVPPEPTLGSPDEDYIPAPPEETLLVSSVDADEESGAEQPVDFWLNASVLRQLSDDLSSLEYAQSNDDAWELLPFDDPSLNIVDPSVPPAETIPTESDRLDNLFAALTPNNPQTDEQPDQPAPDVDDLTDDLTPEGLEAIFAALPVAEPDQDTDSQNNPAQGMVQPSPSSSIATIIPESLGNAIAAPSDRLSAAYGSKDYDIDDDINDDIDLERDTTNAGDTDEQTTSPTISDFFSELPDIADVTTLLPPSVVPTIPTSSAPTWLQSVPTVLQSTTVLQPDSSLRTDATGQPSAGVLLPDATSRKSPDGGTWYLGLDIGTTGISAVLLNRTIGKLYPIGWQVSGVTTMAQSSRLAAIAYLPASMDSTPQLAGNQAEAIQAFLQFAIGSDRPGVLIQNFKPYLKAALPYQAPSEPLLQPIINWSTQTEVPLSAMRQTLHVLLATLQNHHSGWVTASGLDTSAFHQAMTSLSGVILGYPHNWPDTYSVNLRDVVLATGLVRQPEQVLFIEETIAAVLSGLPAARDALKTVSKRQRSQKETPWRGSTLVVNAGASTTELSVVLLPEQVQELTHSDFYIRSLAYAGNALDQDIIGHVLYPAWVEQQSLTIAQAQIREQIVAGDLLPDFVIPRPDVSWEALGIIPNQLPTPGDVDLQRRRALHQRLESSVAGKLLLEAAEYIKLALQYRNSVVLAIGSNTCVIQRRQLESEVFLPYVKRLNDSLNELLDQTGFIPQTVNQVICTGGTASLPAISRWLRQKLPNATIIQDTYAPDHTLPQLLSSGVAHFTPTAPLCSRIAYGLAVLPLYPNVLNAPRQQYGDYLLLSELLQLATGKDPGQLSADVPTLSLEEIMRYLVSRGIDTHACQHRILAILAGHLPPGLVPSLSDRTLFAETSLSHPVYQQLSASPLFVPHHDPINGPGYRPNLVQCRRVQEFLQMVILHDRQSLQHPLAIPLVSPSR